MVVDFEIRKVAGCRLATRSMRGSWPGDKALRAEFEKVQAWAKVKGLKTGKWVFREFGGMDRPERMRFEVGIEVLGKGPVRGGKGIAMKTLAASSVVAVTFDPDVVSPRVVYHGLSDYLKWQRKEGKYKEAGPYREVYADNPWNSKLAWAQMQIQVPVKKPGS